MSAASVSGVLIVDKPRGPTSFDIVAQVRRCFGTRKVGHAGTLDPMATGVLVLLLGEATKLSDYLTQADKAYLARIQFGVSTNTLDAEGTPTHRQELSDGWLDPAALELALHHERQRRRQIPPDFSAIKVNGQRAYRAARSGAPVVLRSRPVCANQLRLDQMGQDFVDLSMDVSKGYYVRALARDLAATLGVPGHLSSLRRVQSGCFTVQDASNWPLSDTAPPPLIAIADAAQRALPCAILTPSAVQAARNGRRLRRENFLHEENRLAAWLSPDKQLVALGEPRPGNTYRVLRGFRSP